MEKQFFSTKILPISKNFCVCIVISTQKHNPEQQKLETWGKRHEGYRPQEQATKCKSHPKTRILPQFQHVFLTKIDSIGKQFRTYRP